MPYGVDPADIWDDFDTQVQSEELPGEADYEEKQEILKNLGIETDTE